MGAAAGRRGAVKKHGRLKIVLVLVVVLVLIVAPKLFIKPGAKATLANAFERERPPDCE
jgi:hypothetical protein